MVDIKLREFMSNTILTFPQLHEIYKKFCNELRNGLGKHTHATADTKCFITYVQDLPTGQEQGNYLALDLGGTNFRVLLVKLKGNYESDQLSKTYPIPSEILVGTATELFDHIASCLEDFVTLNAVQDEKMPLGFTFSFPCTQLGLKKAILVRWTKGFQVTDAVNEDVGNLLREAIERRSKVNIDVIAVVNDTTGTLMSCAYYNPNCRVGLIVGTGCNACYYEHVKCIERLEPEYRNKKNMIINIEMGAFGESGHLDFIRTEYDKVVDENSPNAGQQIFEKMISGMYLGTLVGLILVKAINESIIFMENEEKTKVIEVLTNDIHAFETCKISEIECDLTSDLKVIEGIMKELFDVSYISTDDRFKFKFICECVTKRSASLAALASSALINKINEPKVVVAVDGSLYRLHPRYDNYMRETMRKFVNPKIVYDLMLSEDGSGRGAALIAAVASERNAEEAKNLATASL